MGVVRDVFVWTEIVFMIVDPVVVRRSVVVIHVRCLRRVLLPCCGVLRLLALALKQETEDTHRGSSRASCGWFGHRRAMRPAFVGADDALFLGVLLI